MAKTVVCRIVTGNSASFDKQNTKQTGGKSVVSVLDIYPRSGGEARRLTISQTQILKLNYGDRIRCVSGSVVVLINPGTPAGTFVLYPNLPSCVSWNHRTELEMNDETTKHIHRGKIGVADDIGAVNRAAGGFTR